MAKGMDAFSLYDFSLFLRLRIGALRGGGADVLFGILAGKQPVAGAAHFVVVAKLRQESFGENRVAILAPLARLHSDEHSCAVDVLRLQGDDLADSQPCGIRRLEQDPVLQVGRRLDDPEDFLGRENLRKLPLSGLFRKLQPDVVSFQGAVVEELQPARYLISRAVRGLLLFFKPEKVVLHLLLFKLIGRLHVEPDEPFDCGQIGLLRVFGEVPKLHFPDHSLSQFGHGDTSFAWVFVEDTDPKPRGPVPYNEV